MTYSLIAKGFVDLTAVIESHRQYERDVHFRMSGCWNSKGLPHAVFPGDINRLDERSLKRVRE
ncbi:MAG: hypothetical protein P4L42_02085 [Desulfocapsaceae bacterium]|nr:hypothetical protein [Desulfocapsaceae bacterium]